jgi:hypothetical protein
MRRAVGVGATTRPTSGSLTTPVPAPTSPGYVRGVSDSASRARWVACREFGNELEASIAVAILDGSGIPAVIRSNDSIGLFGPAFQGFSSHGVTVMVPSPALEAARTALALAREAALEDEP